MEVIKSALGDWYYIIDSILTIWYLISFIAFVVHMQKLETKEPWVFQGKESPMEHICGTGILICILISALAGLSIEYMHILSIFFMYCYEYAIFFNLKVPKWRKVRLLAVSIAVPVLLVAETLILRNFIVL